MDAYADATFPDLRIRPAAVNDVDEAHGFRHERDVSGEWTARDGSRHPWRTRVYRRRCLVGRW
jgi:hypothetical protein